MTVLAAHKLRLFAISPRLAIAAGSRECCRLTCRNSSCAAATQLQLHAPPSGGCREGPRGWNDTMDTRHSPVRRSKRFAQFVIRLGRGVTSVTRFLRRQLGPLEAGCVLARCAVVGRHRLSTRGHHHVREQLIGIRDWTTSTGPGVMVHVNSSYGPLELTVSLLRATGCHSRARSRNTVGNRAYRPPAKQKCGWGTAVLLVVPPLRLGCRLHSRGRRE